MKNVLDVAVIGASVAGASFAQQLAGSGVSIALLDRDEFPRRKVCGEGLSGAGVAELKRLGLNIEQLGGVPFDRYTLWSSPRTAPEVVRFSADPPTLAVSPGAGLGVSRAELDRMLLERARSTVGVEVFCGEEVVGVSSRRGYYLIQTARRTIAARYLVLADGANSPTASRLELPVSFGGSRRFGASFALRGIFDRPPSSVHIVLEPGYQVCCTPVAVDQLNISLLVSAPARAVLRDRSALEQTINRVCSQIGFVGEPIDRLKGAARVEGVRRPAYASRILCIGDCCEQLDPIGGMGMTHALISARLAAQALRDTLSETSAEAAAFARYARRRERAIRPMRGFTMLSYQTLATERGARLLRHYRSGGIARLVGTAIHHSETPADPISQRVAIRALSVVGGLTSHHVRHSFRGEKYV